MRQLQSSRSPEFNPSMRNKKFAIKWSAVIESTRYMYVFYWLTDHALSDWHLPVPEKDSNTRLFNLLNETNLLDLFISIFSSYPFFILPRNSTPAPSPPGPFKFGLRTRRKNHVRSICTLRRMDSPGYPSREWISTPGTSTEKSPFKVCRFM
jgi:hypothetical protein